MKISKYLWIDEKVKWNSLRRMRLEKENTYKGRVYIICTSSYEGMLFEVVESQFLSSAYKECYVVGIVTSKKSAMHLVTRLIDCIYNKKTQTYASFKT